MLEIKTNLVEKNEQECALLKQFKNNTALAEWLSFQTHTLGVPGSKPAWKCFNGQNPVKLQSTPNLVRNVDFVHSGERVGKDKLNLSTQVG